MKDFAKTGSRVLFSRHQNKSGIVNKLVESVHNFLGRKEFQRKSTEYIGICNLERKRE